MGAEPLAESRGRAPGQGPGGRSFPEAETLLVFGNLMKAVNLPTFQKFLTPKKLDTIRVVFAKNKV